MLNIAYLALLMRLGEGYCMTLGTGARGTTDAMYVIGGIHRKVVIDDELNPLHIDTA